MQIIAFDSEFHLNCNFVGNWITQSVMKNPRIWHLKFQVVDFFKTILLQKNLPLCTGMANIKVRDKKTFSLILNKILIGILSKGIELIERVNNSSSNRQLFIFNGKWKIGGWKKERVINIRIFYQLRIGNHHHEGSSKANRDEESLIFRLDVLWINYIDRWWRRQRKLIKIRWK